MNQEQDSHPPSGEEWRQPGSPEADPASQILAERLEGELRGLVVAKLARAVVHDLNNSLGLVTGHASLLLEEDAERSELLDSAQAIEEAAERCGLLTRRLSSALGSRSDELRSFLLDEVLWTVEDLSGSFLRRSSIELELDGGSAPLPVHGSRSLLTEALLHLVVNAGEGPTGEGGGSRIRLSARPEGAFVRLLVEDDGPGLLPGVEPRILEPFFSTKPGAPGLGLWAAARALSRQEGRLEYRPGEQGGSSFALLLPRGSLPSR